MNVFSLNCVNLKWNVEELDEYDQCEVEVGISGQRCGGEGHSEIGHAAMERNCMLCRLCHIYFIQRLSWVLILNSFWVKHESNNSFNRIDSQHEFEELPKI